jgi:hypothetical protein
MLWRHWISHKCDRRRVAWLPCRGSAHAVKKSPTLSRSGRGPGWRRRQILAGIRDRSHPFLGADAPTLLFRSLTPNPTYSCPLRLSLGLSTYPPVLATPWGPKTASHTALLRYRPWTDAPSESTVHALLNLVCFPALSR